MPPEPKETEAEVVLKPHAHVRVSICMYVVASERMVAMPCDWGVFLYGFGLSSHTLINTTLLLAILGRVVWTWRIDQSTYGQ